VAGVRVEHLQRAPILSGLSRKELGRIARGMSERTFPTGAEVATEGEIGVGFFIIESGEACVSRGGSEVRRLGPGDHFGEIALIVETPRTATVTAAGELRCHAMTSWDFRKLVETNASVSWKLLQAMARRLIELEQRVEPERVV
jgi:CRP-like cAMP-binding protein